MTISDPPAQRHSNTSLEAAKLIKRQSKNLRHLVLDCILQCGDFGATDEEIQNLLQMNASTERPRRVELVQSGLILKASAKRPTSSGRLASVWVASPSLLSRHGT